MSKPDRALEPLKELARKYRKETWCFSEFANHNRVADELESLLPALSAAIAADLYDLRHKMQHDIERLEAENAALKEPMACGHPKACRVDADTICENCGKGQSKHAYGRSGKAVEGECNNFRGDDREQIPAHCTACSHERLAVAAALRKAAEACDSVMHDEMCPYVNPGNVVRSFIDPAGSAALDAHDAELLKPLQNTAGVFAFEIPAGVADEFQVGTIQNIPVYADEIRRLNAALRGSK